jgi:hypothetical protein
MTHMPFLILDGQGELVLFYCRSGPEDFDAATHSRRWKLWVALEDDQPRRLETGLSDDLMECAPTAWFDATGWHVTFIAGGAKDNPLYHLYRMDGPALDRLSEPMSLQATRAGFVFGDRLAHADPENLIHVRQPSGDFDIELPGAFIYRVSYRADAPDRLLISGQWQTETDVIAIEYDVATGEQHLLEFDGLPAYKCTILGDQVLYAQRIGEHFENRRINESTALLRRSINTLVRRLPGQVQPIVTQPTGDCGCRGRSGEGDALTPGGAPPGSGEENHDHAGPDDVPVSRDEWPLWAKTIARLAASEDRGVGDTIARTIGPVGGDAFKKWFQTLTGHPCGCNARQERLNALYPLGPTSSPPAP